MEPTLITTQRRTVTLSDKRGPIWYGCKGRFSTTWLAAVVCISGAGCHDPRSFEPQREVPRFESSDIPQAPVGTLRDQFTDMVRRVPGGFGGFFFDREGTLTIVLKDPAKSAEAKAQLALEPFVQARIAASGVAAFDLQTARVAPGLFTHAELHQWLDGILQHLDATPTESGVRVHENRIVIGVATKEEFPQVYRAIKLARVPDEAVIVEVSPIVTALTTLYDRIRPVPGGVQMQHTGPGGPICTIGPNALRLGQRAFLTNSHCSKAPFSVNWNDPTLYWQPVSLLGITNHIGNEAIDPPLFQCEEDPNGCRNSDALLGLYASYASYELGYIARPSSRNSGVLALDAQNPRFQIIGQFAWAIDGETLEKVGRTTGWTGGQVIDGCVTLATSHDGVQYSIRCAMTVDAESGGGDSGSPLFKITSGTQVKLRGMVFGGYGSCSQGIDPVFHNQFVLYCTQLAANNLGGIQMDLDPDGNAHLSYW